MYIVTSFWLAEKIGVNKFEDYTLRKETERAYVFRIFDNHNKLRKVILPKSCCEYRDDELYKELEEFSINPTRKKDGNKR